MRHKTIKWNGLNLFPIRLPERVSIEYMVGNIWRYNSLELSRTDKRHWSIDPRGKNEDIIRQIKIDFKSGERH